MALAAIVVISLMISMPGYEAGRSILHGKEQDLMKKNQFLAGSLQGEVQVPPISVQTTPPITTTSNTPPSTISQEAFTGGQFNLSPSLRRKLVKGYVPPSAPNPGTHNPASTRSHNAAPFKH